MIAVLGDIHGHLQLALCVLARWQEELGLPFEGVFLCGDVGTFASDDELDNATRAHASRNPMELEFLTQWATRPQAPWLDYIFKDASDGGLGLACPVVMVHGNHEGFAHLSTISPLDGPIPEDAVVPDELPAVDTNAHLRFLPPGWRCRLDSGRIVAGVGGIEKGQRGADYHPMAYLHDGAIAHLLDVSPIDILITHQGPASMQREPAGSPTLNLLLDAEIARIWFHGHSIRDPDPKKGGPGNGTLVVPLEDIAISGKGPTAGEPGTGGWAVVFDEGNAMSPTRFDPGFLRDFRPHRWTTSPDGLLIAPPLRDIAWRLMH